MEDRKVLSESAVVNILREEYSSWVSGLSELERKAFKKYTYNSRDIKPNRFFERLNAMLRGNYFKADKPILERYADVISGALERHHLEHDIICYRGTNVNPVEGYNEGDEVVIDQFLSTSVVKSKALARKYLLIIYANKGTPGAYIEQISHYPIQREFLINKKTRYQFLSQDGRVIRMEVIT